MNERLFAVGDSYKANLETLEKVFKYLPPNRTNPKTVPAIFGKTYDENFISDFLAYVLDPNENGIGIEPIVKLLEGLENEDVRIPTEFSDGTSVDIRREYLFSSGKRADIVILVEDSFLIVIENKIFSKEGFHQTQDYTNCAKSDFPDHERLFIYLSLNGEKPGSEWFIPLSYEKLKKILKRTNYHYQHDIRRRVLFDEFIFHVEEYLMSSKQSSLSKQTELYLEYIEMIEELRRSFEDDSKAIFRELKEILSSIFGPEWELNFKEERGYQQIYKPWWKKDGLHVHFEIWISYREILQASDFPIMVDVEGRNKEPFFEEFERIFPQYKDTYDANNLEYDRQNGRSLAIAKKNIVNPFRFKNDNSDNFYKELNDLFFLEKVVDKVLIKLENTDF